MASAWRRCSSAARAAAAALFSSAALCASTAAVEPAALALWASKLAERRPIPSRFATILLVVASNCGLKGAKEFPKVSTPEAASPAAPFISSKPRPRSCSPEPVASTTSAVASPARTTAFWVSAKASPSLAWPLSRLLLAPFRASAPWAPSRSAAP